MLKSFSTFRTQLVAFMAATLLVTAIVLSVVNQRLEKETTKQVDDYIQAITQANDAVFQSLATGKYLYEIVNDPIRPLEVTDTSIIQHIFILEEDETIFDSDDKDEIGKKISSQPKSEGVRWMTTSIDTQKARRKILVVISMNQLQKVKDAAARARLGTLAVMGALLILVVAWFSWRATRPISSLAEAARRVASGDLEFEVKPKRNDEIGALATTFNEMLGDLRRKRELEAELRRAEHSTVVGRLASGIAHEIRNPLNFINLSIDHLQARVAPEDPSTRAEHTRILSMIKDEIARLNKMVGDFLSYGRPARLDFREVDAHLLLGEIIELVKAQADEQQVEIELRVDGEESTILDADAKQLRTSFSNLIINAVQAMPHGGKLTITMQPGDVEHVIRISDTGTGIPESLQEQIFEPYYSTKETGIGLGLPLTRKIIEEHGGKIEVSSSIQVGTTFIVTLPRHSVLAHSGEEMLSTNS